MKSPPAKSTMESRTQVCIACMGGTGTGKTTFVNLVGGSKYRVGDDLDSCTDRVQPHQFALDSYDVTLIDMPGFDDTSKSDSDLLRMIADFLLAEYRKGNRVNGILYFHRISDVRVGGASKRNFTMFKKLCGDDAFANVAIVTTRWDQETEAVGNKRLAELKAKPQLFKPVIDGGGGIFKHDRTAESARKILHHLISKTTPKSLLIQREMAEEGKEVLETTAGQELQREITEQVEKHQKEMAELLEEMEQIGDEAGLVELEDECRALRDKMARLQAESQKLAGTPSASKPEPLRENIPAEADHPSNFTVVAATNDFATSSPDTRNVVPGEKDRTTEAEVGQVKEELRTIRSRLENVEKQLVGVVVIPAQLLRMWDRVITILRHAKARTQN